MTTLDIAFSPCPNDTFIFHAMLHGCVDAGPYRFTHSLDDVETLNRLAFDRTHAVTKLSFHAWLLLKDRYALLDAGAALGYGCGPLLAAGKKDVPLADARLAIPGSYTTAYLLLKLWNPEIKHVEETRFDDILPGVRDGRFDAGLIIHEGRFIYPEYGCRRIVDLGEWWESETGSPIPLGCIAIRKNGTDLVHKDAVESILKASVQHALANRAASRDFVKAHAAELGDDVIDGHINLYVNDFTVSLGEAGRRAVSALEEMARKRGVI